MIWWYLSDLRRHKSEREALEALALREDWFTPLVWSVDDRLRLVLDADLTVGDQIYPVSLRYPQSFPHSPPSVLPRGANERWSGHQYGPGGELCLEYRADNWTPDTMGVQMIESAYRLLAGETPSPGTLAVVASAHRTSQGQKMRGKRNRLLLTREAKVILDALAPGDVLSAKLILQFRDGGVVYIIAKAIRADGSEWVDPSLPSVLATEAFECSASISRSKNGATLPAAKSKSEFSVAASELGCDVEADVVIVVSGASVHAYRLLNFNDTVHPLTIIEPQRQETRLAAEYATLSAKKVAIVGCGSLGSKIATMLARAGVGDFLLVDDDVLLPDNFVRNDLDWRDAGLHKADAVASKLLLVRPSVQTQVRRLQLGGQEASASVDATLTALAKCDLAIDATANPVALNIIAGVMDYAKKSALWAEVFAGGFGGLIARCRSGVEPSIPLMRRAIENWFAERGTPPIRAGAEYGQTGEHAPPIADDADVTAIAAPAARLALDCLLERSPSHFPHSIYIIGLAPGPVFDQPFETYPVDLSNAPAETSPRPLDPSELTAEISIIAKLFQEGEH